MVNQNACREDVARSEVGLSFREIADSPHGIGFRALGQQTAHDQIVLILAVDCIEEPHLSFADRAGKCNAWTNTVEREPACRSLTVFRWNARGFDINRTKRVSADPR